MGLHGEATTTVAAPAALIWEMVSDITRMGEWSPESTGGHWLAPATGPSVGARFKGTNKRRSSWTTTAEVTTATPGVEFSFRVGKSKPAVWGYHLAPAESGTVVRETFDVPRYGFADRIMFRLSTGVSDRQADLVSACEQTLGRLKRAAEEAARSAADQA